MLHSPIHGLIAHIRISLGIIDVFNIKFETILIILVWLAMVSMQIFMLRSDLFDAEKPNIKIVADILKKTPEERKRYNRNRKARAIFAISLITLFSACFLILFSAR